MSAAFGQRAVPPPSSVVWPLVRVVFVTPCTKSPYLTFTLRRPDRWGRGVRSEAEGGRGREVVFERLRYKGTLVGHLCLLILRCRAGITRQFRKRTSSVLICVFSAADQRGSLSPSLSLSNSAEHVLVSGLPVSWKLGQKACHRYKTSKQGHPPNHFIKNTAELGDDLCL